MRRTTLMIGIMRTTEILSLRRSRARPARLLVKTIYKGRGRQTLIPLIMTWLNWSCTLGPKVFQIGLKQPLSDL
jgi:hypothetical protein